MDIKKMKKKGVIPLLILLTFTGLLASQDKNKTLAPYFFIENGDPALDQLPLKETNVKVNISGVVAEVIICQRYQNHGKRPINAHYIFPASTRAAVHSMQMIIGNQVIKAKIMRRKVAKKTFEKAKKAGKSASLLEQQRPNVFSMRVANILPGDTIDLELKYTEFLIPTDGTYEFVFPTVVGPRYSSQPESSASEYDQWVKNPYFKEGQSSGTVGTDSGLNKPTIFRISTKISTGIPIQEMTCPSHQTKVSWVNQSTANIVLDPAEIEAGNRDYILKYRLAGCEILSGLLLYQGKKENFFLLMVQPPERVKPENIPSREYIFVVDVSGSMYGFPLDTAKTLLKKLLYNLRPIDRFNVILFAGTSMMMAPQSIPASTENIKKAINILDSQQGGGGTELLSAIKRALDLPEAGAFSRSIVVVTDGYISAEKEVFSFIRGNLNQTNVFAFGIGTSVNRYLIEGMAKAGFGELFIVTNSKEAPQAAERFLKYIQSPVLTDISVQYDGFEAYDVEPRSFPDLLAKRPIVICGKWKGDAQGSITLTGISGTGEYNRTFTLAKIKPIESNHSLKYMWARTRIANLSDYVFVLGADERKELITLLGLTYNLLTKHTSFVAVHEVIRNRTGDSKDVIQPLPLPKGVSNRAVGGEMAKGSEPSLLLVILSLALLLSGRLLKEVYRHKKTFSIIKTGKK